jgi:LacI family transcriptional regulator
MKKRLTSKDIAKAGGVSASTVQMVFRGSPLVAAKTREHVLAVARELGYRPHGGARALRAKKHNAVGFVTVRPFRNEKTTIVTISPGIIDGVNDVLLEHDTCLSLVRISRLPVTDEGKWPRLLAESRVDGLIVTSVVPPEFKAFVDQFNLPAIWVTTNLRAPHDCISFDERAGARTLVRKLIEKGHRRIAFLRGSTDIHYSEGERFAGYVEEMTAAGLDYHRGMEGLVPDDESDQYILRMLKRPDRPTAIVSIGGFKARGVVLAAYRLGMRIPDDISAATWMNEGFGDGGLVPSHMAMIQEEYDLGRRAAELLMEKISSGGKPVKSRVIKQRLYEGESAGPPSDG